MKNKIVFLLTSCLVSFFFPVPVVAQMTVAPPSTVGSVTAIRPLPDGAEVTAGKAVIRITALSPDVIRVRYAPDGNFGPDRSYAVVSETGFTAPQVKFTDQYTM